MNPEIILEKIQGFIRIGYNLWQGKNYTARLEHDLSILEGDRLVIQYEMRR